MNVLQTQNLSKNYGALRAVDNLNLSVEAGNVYGILGPNGSGKTTTLGMILGITQPTMGSFSWFGQEGSAEIRKRIGAILETPNFYPYMDAFQNLEIVARIKNVQNPDYNGVLETVGLLDRAKTQFKGFSLGMRQRLAIAACLLNDPEVLIFDEPTNGLDPQGVADVREILRNVARRGKTILFASHIIDEVEKTCSHVAIMKSGKLLASGSVAEILSQQPTVELGADDFFALKAALSDTALVRKLLAETSNFVSVELNEGATPALLNKFLMEKDVQLTHLVLRKKSLETEFLERIKQ